MAYIIRDAATGYPVPGIPDRRQYNSLKEAHRAAQRAANRTGHRVAFGWAPSASESIKTEHWICVPNSNKGV